MNKRALKMCARARFLNDPFFIIKYTSLDLFKKTKVCMICTISAENVSLPLFQSSPSFARRSLNQDYKKYP